MVFQRVVFADPHSLIGAQNDSNNDLGLKSRQPDCVFGGLNLRFEDLFVYRFSLVNVTIKFFHPERRVVFVVLPVRIK